MTIYTIYADANDHFVLSSNATYSTARSGSGLVDDTSGVYLYAGQRTGYDVAQAFLSFDTSGVMSGTPASASLNIEAVYVGSSTTIDVDIVNWSAGTASFVAGASLAAQSQFGSVVVSSTGYKSISTSTDPARSATYKLMLYDHKQETNTAPTGDEMIYFKSVDWAGTSSDPYLQIDITLPVYYFQRAEYFAYTRI